MQFFCNVPDCELTNFVNRSLLCRFRQHLGEKGIAIIETAVFDLLRKSGAVKGDTLMMDSTVLSSNIIYPTDVILLHKAFGKMEIFACNHNISLWWDKSHLKKRWLAYNKAKKGQKAAFLTEFYVLFAPALQTFGCHVESLKTNTEASDFSKNKAHDMLSLLTLLGDQTRQKLAGERHIDNRIVSLDEVDARPIKKGKTFPPCEFGTTLQMSFNRQGFMITAQSLIGKHNDSGLYEGTLKLHQEPMNGNSDNLDTIVADLGFRSRKNLKNTPESISNLFLGRTHDVDESHQDFCCKARSATEGFIAVAKNWRDFGRSLYRGFNGDRIWTLLCQAAYNLKKFLQLYSFSYTASAIQKEGA
jgi:hypothetical protein